MKKRGREKSWKTRYTVLLLVLFMLNTAIAEAEQGLRPIYSGGLLSDTHWTSSNEFVFIDENSVIQATETSQPPRWQRYSPTLDRLIISPDSPLFPTSRTLRTLGLDSITIRDEKTPLYFSPDGRYVAGLQQTNLAGVWNVFVTRAFTKITLPTDAVVSNGLLPRAYKVLWNSASTAFVAFYRTAWEFPYNVFYIERSSTTSPSYNTVNLSGLEVFGRKYGVMDVHTFSKDGDLLLLTIRDFTDYTSTVQPEQLPTKLALLDLTGTGSAELIDGIEPQTIVGASFAVNDETNILFVSENGLCMYSLTTKTIIQCDESIRNVFRPDRELRLGRSHALFSADREWAALWENYEDSYTEVYVVGTR